MTMNNLIPNAANAQQVLSEAFDIKTHKLTFIDYLEVVISPEGVVEYAIPSHTEKLLRIYMQQQSIVDRNVAIESLTEKSFMNGYIETLSEATKYISVWDTHYITGCQPTQQQLNKLKTLKLHGLYHGRFDDIFSKFCLGDNFNNFMAGRTPRI